MVWWNVVVVVLGEWANCCSRRGCAGGRMSMTTLWRVGRMEEEEGKRT